MRKTTLVIAVVLGLWVTAEAARAWPTTVSGWCDNYTQDHSKWSGTVAEVWGHWRSPSGLSKVQLFVNSCKVYEKTWTSGYPKEWPGPVGSPTWVKVPFPTTQFGNSTVLTLKATAFAVSGGSNSDQDASQAAWNLAYSMGNNTLSYGDDAAGHVESTCWNMHHTVTGPCMQDNADTIAGPFGNYGGRLREHSVAYFYTHGSDNDLMYDDCNSGPEGYDYQIDNYETEFAMDAKTQKSPELPGYNFVHLDACHSSDNPDLYLSFRTKSYLGWIDLSYDSSAYCNWTKALWDGLAMQKTVTEARIYAAQQQPGIFNDSGRGDGGRKVYCVRPCL